MRRTAKLRKIPILFALLLILAAALTLPRVFLDIASAPYIRNDESVPVTSLRRTAPPAPESPVASVAHESPDISAEAPSNNFVTVHMGVSDVSAGSLILINQDHEYDIPDGRGFITIAGQKTQSYRVTNDRMLLSDMAIGPLNDMMDAFCAETGSDSVTVISAFRDNEKQQETLDDYISLVGRAEAQRWAALPGHSEHQSGLAVDFGVYSGGALRTFLGTGVNAWFPENSYKYGFIQRFPENKTDITKTVHEPWHFRYVGEPHAYLMHQNGWCLEEYIGLMSEYTYDEPYKALYNGDEYEIYFTGDTDIPIPFDCEFDISGNNVNGFIVTLKF